MLFNKERAERLLQDKGLDAIIATSPENVMYATGYECTSHWINKGFQLYSIFSPGLDPVASLIIPGLEIDAFVDGDVWVDDVYVFSEFKRGQGDLSRMDEVGRAGKAVAENAPNVATALDGLVASIEARGLQNKKIGIDESNISFQAFEELKRRLPGLQTVPANATWWEIRMVKTPEELRRLERSTRISEEAIRAAYSLIKEGATERQLADAYHVELAKRGARPSFCVIGSGSRSSYPHALVSDRAIRQGDIIRYDIGCTYEYYYADNARAVVLGQPTDEQQRIWDALSDGVDRAVAEIRPGAGVVDLFNTAMKPARSLGLDNFDRFHCGHGIGISVYDPPIVTAADPTKSAFLMPDVKQGLLENMVLNIEVGYYLQGIMGFLCEDTVVVTADGCCVLTRNSKSLDLQTFLASGD